MRAMLIESAADGGRLVLGDVPEPEPGENEVLIAVKAASVNRADLAQRAGTHGGPPAAGPAIAGLDAAGEVVGVGSAVTGPKPGDRVMTMAAGGLSELIAVDAEITIPLPSSWDYAQGAAAVVGLMTQHNALVTKGRLRRGESVVIHAAASGVGLQAVQMASYLGAGALIATVRSLRSADLLRSLGATHVIDAEETDLAEGILAATGQSGADLIVDHVGGPYLEANVKSMAIKGRLIGVGRLGGHSGQLDMEELALKRLEIIGVTFRTRSLEEKRSVVSALRRDLGGALESGALEPRIDAVFEWTEAMHAQRVMAENRHLGKLVLRLGDG